MPARFSLLLAVLFLAGCTVKTTVEVTATTPASVAHMYVTVKELWFTAQADATPRSDEWVRQVLSDPVTIDLVSLNGGVTTALDSLTLDAGRYAQVRLALADVNEDLADSANDLGLDWNNAVQYVDANGLTHLVPLELPHPGGFLTIPSVLEIGNPSVVGEDASSDQSGTVVLDIDALHGLLIFEDDGETRALLNPGLLATVQSASGTITGTFDLSGIASTAASSIVVSAEAANADDTRHVIVKSARLRSDGSFTLYSLPGDPESYDIVVHGAGISTLLVTGVSVQAGETTTLQASNIPLTAASSFLVNTDTAVHAGTTAEFYQNLPSVSVPYLIELAPVNPFGEGFDADLVLSAGPLVVGAYNGGNAITLNTENPEPGLARYRLAGNSRWRARSEFQTVTGNSAGSSTVQILDVPLPALPAASAGTISGTISFATVRRYDALQVLLSRNGQLVDMLDLGSSIGSNTIINFTIANVPSRTADAVYDLSVRAWNSTDPADTLVRTPFPAQADLRQGNAGGLSLQL